MGRVRVATLRTSADVVRFKLRRRRAVLFVANGCDACAKAKTVLRPMKWNGGWSYAEASLGLHGLWARREGVTAVPTLVVGLTDPAMGLQLRASLEGYFEGYSETVIEIMDRFTGLAL